MADLKLDGADELRKAFDAFPREFAKEGRKINRNLVKQIVLPTAKRNIAVRTGFMKSRLKVRAAKNARGGPLRRGIFGAALNLLQDVFYSKWVLFNRRLRDGRIREGDRTLRDALFDNRHRLRSAVNREYRAALPKMAAAARKKKA